MSKTVYTRLESPIGTLLLAGDGSRLTNVGFPSGKGKIEAGPGWRHHQAAFADARIQLTAFFAGECRGFDLPLDLRGTPFQIRVWRELQAIPFGETISYGELARRIGQPTASRAVGAANGVNPIPIIVPCHRVIGANGTLMGFGGGLDTKRWLLDMERGVASAGSAQPRLL